MNHIEGWLYFELKEYIPFVISSSGNICGVKLGMAEFLFVSVSSESLLLGYCAPGVSSLSAWQSGSWLLIEFSLNWEKAW